MAKEFTQEDAELLDQLGVEIEAPKQSARTALEERVIAGFEEIQRFFDEHGRAPQHGGDRDIFERLYAVRLERLRGLPEFYDMLRALDHQGLLGECSGGAAPAEEELDDDALLAELGVEATASPITDLRHVRPRAEIQAAEEIAKRTRCADFATFKPLFKHIEAELESGVRETRRFANESGIEPGRWFILGGQIAYVAAAGEEFVTDYDRKNRKLRLIFDNGTESDMLQRSLHRALRKDEAGRRITEPSAGPLFGDTQEDDDAQTGTIYILRSKSDHPEIAANRHVIHKIGVTGGDVQTRIANAKLDATFLLADVETVTTYTLYNINRSRLENLLHRIFAPARLDLEIEDRFGNPVRPREWFLVPFPVIEDAVNRIIDGSILDCRYDPASAQLVKVSE